MGNVQHVILLVQHVMGQNKIIVKLVMKGSELKKDFVKVNV